MLWGCPVHRTMFSNISGLHPLSAGDTTLSRDNQKCLSTLLNGFWRGKFAPG